MKYRLKLRRGSHQSKFETLVRTAKGADPEDRVHGTGEQAVTIFEPGDTIDSDIPRHELDPQRWDLIDELHDEEGQVDDGLDALRTRKQLLAVAEEEGVEDVDDTFSPNELRIAIREHRQLVSA